MTTRRPIRRVLFASPWWHSDIVNGVLRHAARLGWHVDLQTCLTGQLPGAWSGDGIVTQLGGDLHKLRRLLNASGCPAVSLNQNHPEISVARVSTDSHAAGKAAARHFLARGFRCFAFYGSFKTALSTQQRYAAYRETVETVGLTTSLLEAPEAAIGPSNWDARQDWLRTSLASLPKPLAVTAVNDQAAVEVIEAAQAESLSVPDQVAVLGMLNMQIFRDCTTVSLSSVAFDFDEITARACDVLDAMMHGQPGPTEPVLFRPVGVVQRASTDTLATYSPIVAKAVRFMLDRYADDISINDIAKATGGSRAGLFNAFNRERGETPGRVLTGIRVNRAKRMLEETDEKIYTVASECGFGRPINLHRAFKQQVGQTPAAYRASVAKASASVDP